MLDQNDEEKADGKSHDTSRHPLILLNDAVLQILNIKYNNDDVSDIHSGYIPPISSTELLVETASAWEFVGDLPSPRTGLRAANIDTKILVTGP